MAPKSPASAARAHNQDERERLPHQRPLQFLTPPLSFSLLAIVALVLALVYQHHHHQQAVLLRPAAAFDQSLAFSSASSLLQVSSKPQPDTPHKFQPSSANKMSTEQTYVPPLALNIPTLFRFALSVSVGAPWKFLHLQDRGILEPKWKLC